jgi:hypothetical protein
MLALLLSLIVVMLTTVPCCAAEEFRVEKSGPGSADSLDKDTGCCQSCSPFFACCTGTGFTVSTDALPSFILFFNDVVHDSPYLLIRPFILSQHIWQPPQ